MTLECTNLTKSYGVVVALDKVSVRFPSKGVVAIVGRNGAGKTTLIDSLTGVVKLDQGEWFLNGRRITDLSIKEVVEVGIVRSFQGIRLLQDETVLSNLCLAVPSVMSDKLFPALIPRWTRREDTAVFSQAISILELAGFKDKADTVVEQLSYGDQKLVSLLVASATGAQILLLDEPLAGTDVESARLLLRFASRLRSEGKLLIFVEHDLAAVRQLADTVIVMDQGKVLAVGATEEVLSQPSVVEAYLG